MTDGEFDAMIAHTEHCQQFSADERPWCVWDEIRLRQRQRKVATIRQERERLQRVLSGEAELLVMEAADD